MTITPMSTPVVAPGAAGAGAAGVGAAATLAATPEGLGFGALVAALVADAGTPAESAQCVTAESTPDDTTAELPEPAEEEEAESAQCCTTMPPILLAVGLPVPLAISLPAPTGPVTTSTGTADALVRQRADSALTAEQLVTDPGTPTLDVVRRPEGAAADAPAAAAEATIAATTEATVQQRVDSASPTPATVQQRADSASTPAPTADPGAAAAAAGVTGTSPTAGASAERPAAPPATAAVTRQVFPEVTRLASSGPGTHHLTLRLDPGSLGEVRVTLTVRAGTVRVSLAAGQEARDALLHSSPDLRRLLELGGADATVTIRDLGATGTNGLGGLLDRSTSRDDTAAAYARAAGEQVPSGSDRPGAGDSGPPRGSGHDHHARTREDTTARDGSPDPTTPSRPVELRTSRGPLGLDVSI